jgi:hypothetical protein
MTPGIVHCPPETKHFLTVETNEGGVVRSALANLDGTPVLGNGVRYAGDDPAHVAVYLDTISGDHFAKVTPDAAILITKNGGKIFHGCGSNGGLFVAAPDFTLRGRFGEKKSSKPAADDADEHDRHTAAMVREPAKVSKFENPAKRSKR